VSFSELGLLCLALSWPETDNVWPETEQVNRNYILISWMSTITSTMLKECPLLGCDSGQSIFGIFGGKFWGIFWKQ